MDYRAPETNEEVYVCMFCRFQEAYDHVDISILRSRGGQCGMNGKMLLALKSLEKGVRS